METDIKFIKQVNETIFLKLNAIFGQPHFKEIIILYQNLLDSSALLIYVGFFALTSIYLLFKHRKDEIIFEQCFLNVVSCFVTFTASAIALLLALVFKNHTDVIRPLCTYDHIYQIAEITKALKCNKSFPSGHMSLAVAVIASFWPLFNKLAKSLAIVFVILAGISRIAAGAHYPIDLLGAVAIVLPLILYSRGYIKTLCARVITKLDLTILARRILNFR
jgi:membrane-associated phospholipid phosphatase